MRVKGWRRGNKIIGNLKVRGSVGIDFKGENNCVIFGAGITARDVSIKFRDNNATLFVGNNTHLRGKLILDDDCVIKVGDHCAFNNKKASILCGGKGGQSAITACCQMWQYAPLTSTRLWMPPPASASITPDYIQLCLYTGMRWGEVTSLTWGCVGFVRKLITLKAGTTKNGRRRTVPLHDMAIQALDSRKRFCRRYCPTTPWVMANKKGERMRDTKKSFASACRAAGIANFRQHDQCHTFARQTERYAHLHPEALREAIDNLKPAQNSHASTSAVRAGMIMTTKTLQYH